jgi:23S rRNA (uracil1939-C5)-methyltransferase
LKPVYTTRPKKLYKSNIINTKIEKIIYGGSGLATFDGIKVFVPHSAPGDFVQIKITEKKSNYYVAEIKKIVEPSLMRILPPCPYFKQCGGCDFQHVDYQSQLSIKKDFAIESLSRIGHTHLSDTLLITPSSPFRYRNKTQYPLAGRPLKIGYYRQLSHHVIDIEQCLLHPQIFDNLRLAIKELIVQVKETIYNEVKHSGNLRHIVIRQGVNTGEILLTYVTRTPKISEDLFKHLPQKFSNIVGITHNINPDKTNRILGDKNRILFGNDYFHEKILDKTFKISTTAFFQVNTNQAENMVKKLREYIGSGEQVLDLYCGVGMLSIMISDLAQKITGIEISKRAVRDAIENLKINNINNIQYIAAPVEVVIRNYQNIDIVILDPPRKGCSDNFLNNIIRLKPKKIIYISCNPTTFARDLAILNRSNYHLDQFELFDMFPQTYHVESIAKIVQK